MFRVIKARVIKVAHSRIVHKLEYYGVRGMVLNWIKALPSDRKQQVVLIGYKPVYGNPVPCREYLQTYIF